MQDVARLRQIEVSTDIFGKKISDEKIRKGFLLHSEVYLLPTRARYLELARWCVEEGEFEEAAIWLRMARLLLRFLGSGEVSSLDELDVKIHQAMREVLEGRGGHLQ